jgi:hypothetical protein
MWMIPWSVKIGVPAMKQMGTMGGLTVYETLRLMFAMVTDDISVYVLTFALINELFEISKGTEVVWPLIKTEVTLLKLSPPISMV